eukprot:6174857-Pleurochrysis_carterae.AAC.2
MVFGYASDVCTTPVQMLGMGCVPYMTAWLIVFASFWRDRSQYNNNDTELVRGPHSLDTTSSPPSFVTVIIILQFILFTSFAIVQSIKCSLGFIIWSNVIFLPKEKNGM